MAFVLAALAIVVLWLPERSAPIHPRPVAAERTVSVPMPDLAAAARALELDELRDVSFRVAVGEANPDWIAISTSTAIAVSRDGGRQFHRLDAPTSAELPAIGFDGRGRLVVRTDDGTYTDLDGILVPTSSVPAPPVPLPLVEYADDGSVVWRGAAGWKPVWGLPAGEVTLVDAPWPALHAAGGLYEVVNGLAQWRLAIPGPYEDGDLINAVSIDRAGRVWLTAYEGGGDCDGSENLTVAGVVVPSELNKKWIDETVL